MCGWVVRLCVFVWLVMVMNHDDDDDDDDDDDENGDDTSQRSALTALKVRSHSAMLF